MEGNGSGISFSWSWSSIKRLALATWTEFNADEAPRLGASLAYYTILSLAPLLVLVISVVGLVFGEEAARGQISFQIDDMVGQEGGKAIQEMIKGAGEKKAGIWASVLGFATLLLGASSVVGELRFALNRIWNTPPKDSESFLDMIKQRSYAIAVVLGIGFLLLVSLVLSAGVSAAGKFLSNYLPAPEIVLQIANFVASFLLVTLLFGFMFRFLPEIWPSWRDVMLGAVMTALLFTIGKTLIGIYLGKASVGSTFGAAGSLVVVLVWVYYSAQIFFLGAEFTQVYAREHGSNPAGERAKQKLFGAPRWKRFPEPPEGTKPALPRILPLEVPSRHTLAENLGALAGAMAGFGKGVVKAVRKPAEKE